MADANPRPVQVLMCTLCSMPWSEHLEHAERRWWREIGDEDEYVQLPAGFPVGVLDCVTVLREHQRGPAGPVGPMGAQGIAGALGPRGMTGAPGRQASTS